MDAAPLLGDSDSPSQLYLGDCLLARRPHSLAISETRSLGVGWMHQLAPSEPELVSSYLGIRGRLGDSWLWLDGRDLAVWLSEERPDLLVQVLGALLPASPSGRRPDPREVRTALRLDAAGPRDHPAEAALPCGAPSPGWDTVEDVAQSVASVWDERARAGAAAAATDAEGEWPDARDLRRWVGELGLRYDAPAAVVRSRLHELAHDR